jgi:hypothetical protein
MTSPKWQEKYSTSPVYSLNKYIQDKLVEMEFIDITDYVSDFNGTPNFVLPFLVPGQEVPELETIYDQTEFKNLAYGIYSMSHRYSPDEPYIICSQVSYTFYHDNMDILIAMSEYLVDLLCREDWSASDINVHFRSSTTYPFEFKTVYVLTSAGPAPSEDEGGRHSFMIVVKFDATYEGAGRNYTITLAPDTNYIEQGLR